ncbi:CLUMA_CG014141, isoform A [Clunio marinus]|uniref:CLUMA_CG014141, isoform A n=1 Tax=Clunio marinus TaxID=568069 RepID=A0A1J1IMC5_9DIPT|nr:CLUMA_CG014141, isoform A [Clunio marinus]
MSSLIRSKRFNSFTIHKKFLIIIIKAAFSDKLLNSLTFLHCHYQLKPRPIHRAAIIIKGEKVISTT